MATWTHTIGAASTEDANYLAWLDISEQITGTPIAGASTFLSRVDVDDGTFTQILRTNGPDLSSKWERSHIAITVSAGGLTVVIPGPNSSIASFTDSTEPYRWSVSSQNAEFTTFIAAYKALTNAQKDATTVTLDDTPPDAEAPPVTISAVTDADEFDALELSATVTHPTARAYDRLSYSWQVVSGGGSLSTPVNTPTGGLPTRSSVTYTPADVSSDTNVQVRCTVTAEGTGNYAVSGTSDTETDTEDFVVNFIDDSSTDTEQEFPVGATTSSSATTLQWLDLDLWVQAGLRADTATHARLHSVILAPGVQDVALRLQQFSGDSELDAGPDLISDFELSGHIIIEARGESHTIHIAPDSSNSDTAEPYVWLLSDEQPLRDFITAYNALSDADKAGTTVTLRVPPSATAPTVVITDISSVDEDATVDLSLGLSGGSYDAATYAWTVVSGGGSFADATLDTVTFTPADVSADTAVQVRCTVTVTGNGSNALLDSTTNAVATETFTVNYVPPDAVAPTLTIGSVAAFDENSTAALNANVSGGTYDSLSYAWSVVLGGGSITNTGASVIYNPPDITADTDVTVRCTVTADGTGGDAKNGTSDTATDTVLFTVNFIPGAINAEGSASINLSFTATGDAGLNEAPAFSAEGSASINLSFTATGDAGLGDPPALNAEGSASINLSFTATGDAGLGDPPLVLADWTTPADETVIVLALVQANISGVDLFDAPGDEVGTGNDLVIGADLSLDMVERHASPQPPVRLRGTGGGEFSPYFSTGGTYESAALYIQTTPTKVIGFTHGNSGGGYSNWNYADSSDASDFTGISTGDRFIVAITTPTIHAPLSAEGSASINLSFTATGDAGLGDPPALNAEGSASVDLSFTATGDAGLGDPPALNAEGSASINLSFTATGDAGLGDPPLVLADWTTPADETVIVLALVQANISGVDLFDAPGDEVGTGNDLVIGADLSLDMVERHPSGQLPVRLRKTGAGDFSTYFNTGGTYESAALYIQTTPTKVIGFTHGNSGGGYSNWNYADSSDASDFTGISTGDRFIVAITTPAVHASLNAEGSASVDLSFTAAGDAGLGDPPALNAEGSASINLSFTATGDAGLNEAPALNAEGSASINLSFTATGDAGLNEAPALNAEGSASINLSFTATGDAGLNEAPALSAEGSASINLSFTATGHAGLGASLSLNAGGSASINLTVDADGDAALAGVASAEDARRKNAMSLAGQAPIYAIEISHPALTDPVRAVADTIPHTIEGNDFPRLFFRFVRPQDQEKQVSRAQAEIDNVGAALTEWVETTNGGRGATMRVMEITPAGGVSEVTWEVSLGVVVSEILGSVVRVTLQGSRLHGRRLVLLRHDPSTSPGAFD